MADRIPIDAVYCYKQDRQGNDWLGLARNGLLRKPSASSLFTLFPPLTALTDGIIDVEKAKENYGITVVHSLPSNRSYDVIAVTTAHDIIQYHISNTVIPWISFRESQYFFIYTYKCAFK